MDNQKFEIGTSAKICTGNRLKVSPMPKQGDTVIICKRQFKLEKEVASGGEGSIYKIGDNFPFVVKIYKKESLTRNKVKKIEKMLEKKIEVEGICWPREKVYNTYGEFIGYVMKEAKGYEIQRSIFIKNLFLNKFSDWKKRDLVELSITILKKIKYLHERNIIIGDLNPANILVASPREVYFVDTDSYQIENFPCEVGMIEYTAPEIQGMRYSEFLRSQGHEYFAVAILLFKLMLPGKSPYSFQGGGSPKENILSGNFSYAFKGDTSSEQQGNEKAPQGPWRYIWSHLPYKLKQKFFKTFNKNGEHSKEDTRLNIDQWLEVFEEYLYLLDSGKFGAQDPMSEDIFPTRFKKIENSLYQN